MTPRRGDNIISHFRPFSVSSGERDEPASVLVVWVTTAHAGGAAVGHSSGHTPGHYKEDPGRSCEGSSSACRAPNGMPGTRGWKAAASEGQVMLISPREKETHVPGPRCTGTPAAPSGGPGTRSTQPSRGRAGPLHAGAPKPVRWNPRDIISLCS